MNNSFISNLSNRSTNTGVYINGLLAHLLTIVNCSTKEEILKYISSCGQQLGTFNMDRDLEAIKREVFRKYQDSLNHYLKSSQMSRYEKAKQKLEELGISDKDKIDILNAFMTSGEQTAYQLLESRYGIEIREKFNHSHLDDYANIKSASYEQIAELNRRIKSDTSIDTIVMADVKYNNCMFMTGNGIIFDPFYIERTLDYARSIGKNVRLNALFDTAIAEKFKQMGYTQADHDKVLSAMQRYVSNMISFVQKYNQEHPNHKINTIEIFNELIEYKKDISERDSYDEIWLKNFGISLEEIIDVFDKVPKPDGVRFMYNETLLEESPIRLQKVEETINRIREIKPNLIDVFGNQMHIFIGGHLQEQDIITHQRINQMLKRLQDSGLPVEITEFDITVSPDRIIQLSGISDDVIYGVKSEVARQLGDLQRQAGLNLERTTYWNLLPNVSHRLTNSNVQRLESGKRIIPTLYNGLYGDLTAPKTNVDRYLEDFSKIQELMSRTMDKYSKDFLEANGLPNPLADESKKQVFEQLCSCSSDREYAEIVSSYLQSFEEGHLYLKSKEQKTEITPLFVKQVDGRYIISATKDRNLEGQELTTINGIPIEEYLINKGFQQDIEMKIIDQNGNPITPEFHIEEDSCNITMLDGENIQIDNIPISEAIELKHDRQIVDSPNIVCGYTDEGIPYIRIKKLDGKTKEQAKQQLSEFAKQLNEQGQTDLVIDIRGNKGGSDEYIEYLGAFSDNTYSDEHEYEQLVGISEQETNEKNKANQIEDIDTTLKRIEQTSNREIGSHTSVIPNGNSSISHRLLLIDGDVFSSADKMAKTIQDSGFATLVGSELTAGDGKGVSIHQVDTPILREHGLSITMPSSMGLDYSEFQTTPDIMVSEHEINTNLGQIMEQTKDTVIEWEEAPKVQEQDFNYTQEQEIVTNTYVESPLQFGQSQLNGQALNQVGANGQMGNPTNSASTISSGGRGAR